MIRVRRLRYPSTCSGCGMELPKGTPAEWNREEHRATCVECLPPEARAGLVDHGTPGASALRTGGRRRDGEAWAAGAQGEHLLGTFLEPLRHEGIAVLHDRRIPRTPANIDHVIVAPTGIYVVDAKHYRGRIERRGDRLVVADRNRTRLVEKMTKQAGAVRAALEPEYRGVPIVPAICFVEADWASEAADERFDDVHVLTPPALARLVRADGAMPPETIAAVERKLALALPAA